MKFSAPLVRGVLVKRYKRFLADIVLDSGEELTAHCANPGSMRTCLEPGGAVWLSKSDNPKRKLPYSWELAKVGQQMICINTAWANRLVGEGLRNNLYKDLEGGESLCGEVRSEVPYGEKSRIDFLVENDNGKVFVEVKSVTLAGPGLETAFPDSVTARGQKHLRELMAMREAGHRAMMLFCCLRDPTEAVRPADELDPVYGQLLRQAHDAGVELLAVRYKVSPSEFTFAGSVPLLLEA